MALSGKIISSKSLQKLNIYLKDRNYLRDKCSLFPRIFAEFAKLNPREKPTGSQFAKLNPCEKKYFLFDFKN